MLPTPVMAHTYNRRAFGLAASGQPTALLCELYVRLIHLELALKDQRPASVQYGQKGHDVPGLLDDLEVNSQRLVDGHKITTLRSRLSALRCTSQSGATAPVRAEKYPDVRYLVHSSDAPGGSSDDNIRDVLDIIRDIERVLKSHSIWP